MDGYSFSGCHIIHQSTLRCDITLFFVHFHLLFVHFIFTGRPISYLSIYLSIYPSYTKERLAGLAIQKHAATRQPQ